MLFKLKCGCNDHSHTVDVNIDTIGWDKKSCIIDLRLKEEGQLLYRLRAAYLYFIKSNERIEFDRMLSKEELEKLIAKLQKINSKLK